MNTRITIIKDEARLLPLLATIIEVTNANTSALGFLPRAVYEEALKRNRLWIAVDKSGIYQAHLLFGGIYPTMKIKQMFVVPEARQQGLARLMIEELVRHSEDHGYSSIRARVAVDLDANAAWERLAR